MEEVRHLKHAGQIQEKDKNLQIEKLRIYNKRIGDLEGIITDYKQRDHGHTVTRNFGNGVSEDDVHDVQDPIHSR